MVALALSLVILCSKLNKRASDPKPVLPPIDTTAAIIEITAVSAEVRPPATVLTRTSEPIAATAGTKQDEDIDKTLSPPAPLQLAGFDVELMLCCNSMPETAASSADGAAYARADSALEPPKLIADDSHSSL